MKKKFLITILSLVFVLGCAFALAACGNGTVHVTNVTLSTRLLYLEEGEEETLTAEVLPENATDKTVTWTVDNDSVVTVDNNGKVTAISAGEALVRAMADNTFEECHVFVTPKVLVNSISMENRVTLVANGETTLETRVSPANAKTKISWAVEPAGVVSVDNGKLTALAQGEAIVTATADDATANCYVTVTQDGLKYVLSSDGQSYSVEQNYDELVDLTETEVASEFNGKPVTKIGRWAFSALNDILTKLKIPASVTEIDTNSLSYCKKLESIEVDENNPEFTSIGGILYNKAATQSIFVPYGLSGVVTIPESMTKISDYMFQNRNKITGVIMHDGVTAIGESAFWGCKKIHSITIPENMTEIGKDAFGGCYKLWEIYNFSHLNIVTGGDAWTATYGGIGLYALNILYMKNDPSGIHATDDGYTFYIARDNKVYLIEYAGEESELVLPDGYNGADYEIHSYAFDGCSAITSVTIPNKVTAIGDEAFNNCTNLVSVTISSSVTKLGSAIFNSASKLETITYNGTEAQWGNITKPNNWDAYCGKYTIHYTEE